MTRRLEFKISCRLAQVAMTRLLAVDIGNQLDDIDIHELLSESSSICVI